MLTNLTGPTLTMANPKQLELSKYLDSLDSFEGWCENCQQITSEGVNPDAAFEYCPQCETECLFGMEEAFVRQLFYVH